MSVGISFGSPTSGTGFVVSTTVSSIMANLQGVETPWKTQISSIDSQDTVFSSLGTLLSNLSTDMTNLTEASGVLSEKEGSSSDTSVLDLTAASTTAIAGTHNVVVSALAATSSGYLNEITNSSDTLSGSMVIQVGSGTAQTITLTSSDNTLSGLASAINAAGVGVTASVLTDATGSRLSLVSGTSGANGDISISGVSPVAGSSTTSGITDTTTSTALNYTTAAVGANGTITVDGAQLEVSSNTVSDLIPGVTFSLLSTSTTAVQVVIANYNSGVESTVAALVSDYNALVSSMNTQDGYNTSGVAEPLFGSPTLTMLQQDLLGGINASNPNGYLDSVSTTTAVGAKLSGSIVIQVGTGTAQTVTMSSSDTTLAGLASAINSANIGVTAAVVTNSTTNESTLTLASHTTGSNGALAVTSAINSTGNTALGYTGSTYTSTTDSSGTVGKAAASTDTLSGSIVIQVGSGTAQTITINSSNNTLSKLASAIGSDGIGVTATVITNSDHTSSLQLQSNTVGSAGALTVTSSLYDITGKTTSTLGYTTSSDITSLSALGISVNSDGTISLDVTSLDSVLNSDFSGVQGLFQNANGWGTTFSNMLTNAGSSSSTGIIKLAETSNSSIESTLNADISREDMLISSEAKSLTAELNSANEIMQEIPMELSSVNELYSAITGYNQTS